MEKGSEKLTSDRVNGTVFKKYWSSHAPAVRIPKSHSLGTRTGLGPGGEGSKHQCFGEQKQTWPVVTSATEPEIML